MASKPLAIVGTPHICPKVDPGPRPHVGGPITSPGQNHVKFNGIPWAVEGGAALCTGVPCTDSHSKGSSTVKINGKGVMRQGDSTAHGGRIAGGIPAIKIS